MNIRYIFFQLRYNQLRKHKHKHSYLLKSLDTLLEHDQVIVTMTML